MSINVQKDSSDLRILCKYGTKCYQTNHYHHNKYKHPASPSTATTDVNPDEEQQDETDVALVGKRKHEIETENTIKKQKIETNSENNKSENNKCNTESKSTTRSYESGGDVNVVIKDKFQVNMPDDFYEFWVFCKSLLKDKPADALYKLLGFKLVGPYDVLRGVESNSSAEDYMISYRYFYDPPEFMTVIASDKPTQYHMGYFRDDPKEMPVFVGSNMSRAKKNPHVITAEGDNIFTAIRQYVQTEAKQCKDKNVEKQLKDLDEKLLSWCKRHSFSEDLKSSSSGMKERRKRVVCKSFHGAGLVVPMHNDVGYRDLQYSDGELRKMFNKIHNATSDSDRVAAFEPLQEMVTCVQFANDECDYGMGLELGIDMFCTGSEYLHKTILSVLPLAYQLLGRELYADIIAAHLRHRSRDAPAGLAQTVVE